MLREEPTDPHIYRIGAVSRLTSIPTGTIRVWERRYGVVEPGRSDGGFRLYSHRDVERLRVIKALIESGETIGGLASLDLGQLRQRLQAHGLSVPDPLQHPLEVELPDNGNGPHPDGSVRSNEATPEPPEPPSPEAPLAREPLRVVAVGESLPVAMRLASTNFQDLNLVGTASEWREQGEKLAAMQPDLLLLEQSTVHVDTAEELSKVARISEASHTLVVYQFGSEAALRSLESQYVTPIKGPLGASQLQLALRLARDRAEPSQQPERTRRFIENMDHHPPPARFDPATMARIAAQSRVVHCECPQHLATLISSLMAFEAYCRECESRSEEDAALHAALERSTGQARSTLEDALEYLLEVENIVP